MKPIARTSSTSSNQLNGWQSATDTDNTFLASVMGQWADLTEEREIKCESTRKMVKLQRKPCNDLAALISG